MKKYNFLFKPVFYIFSLLFATWLVIEIEKIRPSDASKEENAVLNKSSYSDGIKDRKKYLKNLFFAYKEGVIDSVLLNKHLSLFLKVTDSIPAK